MHQTDYFIVGSGLAGITLAHSLHQQGHSFNIISDPNLSHCSKVAAGIYNPVVFYRITKSYMADTVLPFAETFYKTIEILLNKKLLYTNTIAKIFAAEQEQQLWQQRREEGVGFYLGEITNEFNESPYIKAKQGIGLVKHTGNLDCAAFIDSSLNYFKENTIEEQFEYDNIIFHKDNVEYKNTSAKKIIFCEGHLISQNPFFKNVALKPVKGEILTIQFNEALPENAERFILNKKCFLLPAGNNIYKVGATYNWKDLNEITTEDALLELKKSIQDITPIPYTVLNHLAGVRPAASDRRPILGVHPGYPQLAVFNGLGTKGVFLAPYFANELVQHITGEKPLHKEVNVIRFFR